MTIHILTITPNHVITVSDRLIYTPSGYIELGDDRYKHLILICDNARVVTSFAGIACIVFPSRKGKSFVKHETIDWITKVFQETSKKAHGIDDHLNDLRDQIQPHIDSLKQKYNLQSDKLKLAIQISGWVGVSQFNCVIDNYLDTSCLSSTIRPQFKTRHKIYGNEISKNRSSIFVIGREFLNEKKADLFDELVKISKKEKPKEIFQASVKIIRAAAINSNGRVGMNCSGVRISRNDPGIEAFDDRDQSVWDVVMPNTVLSTSKVSVTTSNMRGRNL
jgi:hypothetical protein